MFYVAAVLPAKRAPEIWPIGSPPCTVRLCTLDDKTVAADTSDLRRLADSTAERRSNGKLARGRGALRLPCELWDDFRLVAMFGNLQSRLTYANVIATLAAIAAGVGIGIALGQPGSTQAR